MINIGKNIILVGVLLVLPHFLFSQPDTTRQDSSVFITQDHMRSKQINEIHISRDIIKIRKYRTIESSLIEKEIQLLAPDDAGDLIQKLPSTNVKSYGGLGSLKTVSIHSMGSGHTSVVLDGVVLTNSQSGQVNLGQIQTDGLRSVMAYSGYGSHLYIPVSATISGSSVSLGSFQTRYSLNKSYFKANVKYGSFNRQEVFVGGGVTNKKKLAISAFGKYRKADGNYNYEFKNGLTTLEGQRANNDYQDLFFGGAVKYKKKDNNYINLGYKGSVIDQGLPGAVILYNQTADERLKTSDHSIYGDAVWEIKKMYLRTYGSFNQNDLNYSDPSYLNTQGFLDVSYLNNTGIAGLVFQKFEYQKLNFSGGIEETLSSLVSSDSSLSKPIRFHTKSYFSLDKDFSWGAFSVMLSAQYMKENTRIGSETNELFKMNPVFAFWTKEFYKRRHKHGFTYKNTFRVPSFNELYYNYIGNTALLPETAHQFNYSAHIIPYEKDKVDLIIRPSLYFNRVNNKIVAIPTKNLFVWSMQNVTNVNVLGADISVELSLAKGESKFGLFTNYSFQRAIDVTEESLNYGHQIAYTPIHMANFDVSYEIRSFGFRFSNNFTGGRYALNENVESNLVAGYLISDIAVNYTLPLKEKHKLSIQANVKNVFNQSYAYVRSFVMPGRNYLISLNYAFN